jgi:hypothetical protein
LNKRRTGSHVHEKLLAWQHLIAKNARTKRQTLGPNLAPDCTRTNDRQL